MFVKKTLAPQLKGDKKSVVLLISRSKSADDISKGAEQLKGSGLTLAAVGTYYVNIVID